MKLILLLVFLVSPISAGVFGFQMNVMNALMQILLQMCFTTF